MPVKAPQLLDASGVPIVRVMRERAMAVMERSHYDSASPSRLMDFSNAQDVGANEALDAELSTLRTRSRFEMRNNSYAKGLGRTYANVVVGRGPILKIQSPNEEWAQNVEWHFASYAKKCGYRRRESLGALIHQGVRQFFPCGEFFIVPRMDVRAEGVQIRWLMIRPDRVQNPSGKLWGQGIETDRDGRPTKYWVLKDDPDNLGAGGYYSWQFDEVPAERMIHVFMADDPVQLRGEPWLAQALKIFHKIRRVDEGVTSAVEMANKFAGFLCALHPEMAGMDQETLVPSTMELMDGMLTTVPPGYEPKQIQPQFPQSNLPDFRRDQLAAAGRSACMPVNAVTGDSSRHNFASARFDGTMLITDGEFVHEQIEGQCLDPIFSAWYREAISPGVRLFPPASAPFYTSWLWRVNDAHTDPTKAIEAKRIAVASGHKTVGDTVLEDGRDDVDHYKRLVAEVAKWRGDGLKHPLDAESKEPKPEKPTDGSGGSDGENEKAA